MDEVRHGQPTMWQTHLGPRGHEFFIANTTLVDAETLLFGVRVTKNFEVGFLDTDTIVVARLVNNHNVIPMCNKELSHTATNKSSSTGHQN
jgi:hypothetical protein